MKTLNVEKTTKLLTEHFEAEEVEVDKDYEREYNVDGAIYKVLYEDEILEEVTDTLGDTISYFNASFLSDMTGLPQRVFEALVDENEAVQAIVEITCGMKEFVEEAVRVDGAGHFLSQYDGEEHEIDEDLVAFRVE